MDEEKKRKSAQAGRDLCGRLGHYFEHQLRQEQPIEIKVTWGEQQSSADDHSSRCVLHFELPDGTLLAGHLHVESAGGNMYEVEAGIGDRTERFGLSLPEEIFGAEGNYGQAVYAYLFEEVKQVAGELFLRQATAQKASSQQS